MNLIWLFGAELKRGWILQRRYVVETIALMIGLTLVFCGLLVSTQNLVGPDVQLGDRLDALVVSYVLWSLSLFIMGNIAGELQQEAQTGTLEQLFLSPIRAAQLLIIRALANLAPQLVINLAILILIMAITGNWLSFSLFALPPLITVLLSAYGLSLVLGSLALLFKKVQQVLAVFQFLLFFMLMAPMETWTGPSYLLGWLLPITPSAGLLRNVISYGAPLDWILVLLALLNSALYLGLGLLLFHWAERKAKKYGGLGGY
ncbi:MAG: ABC transporter permease [Leptolyngbyaceae cyanobacterium MO_188.B28]|nr:ABC transporter permease [Leptolyngbyaceae cyanobacterium MO_188.B28]